MLIAIIGENCAGKSTLANQIKEKRGAAIYSGKDYLRLEKSPALAMAKFRKLLQDSLTGEDIIYIITEKEHIGLLPEGAFRIVLTAELETIKSRFKERMRGNLPVPVERMLETRHGMYDTLACDLKLDGHYRMEDVIAALEMGKRLR